jgi:hypothetical protein
MSRRKAVACDEAYDGSVEARFEAALQQIEAANRQLTPWEGQCLLMAVKAIATGDWLLADQQIGWSQERAPTRLRMSPTLATLEGLRSALEMSRRVRELQRKRAQDAP